MSDASLWLSVGVQVCLGVSLAACAGLRAFLPLLVLSLLARSGYINVAENFQWIGSNPAMIVFGVATAVEIMGDKIPMVDNFLDSAGFFIKPVAGTLLFSTVIIKMDPLLAVVLGIIAGGSLSELVHVRKAALRLASTSLSAGAGNPFLSFAEDAGAVAGVALSFLLPILAAFVVLIGLYVAYRLYRRHLERKKERMCPAGMDMTEGMAEI